MERQTRRGSSRVATGIDGGFGADIGNDAPRPLMLGVLRTITERLQPTMEQWSYGVPSRGERPGVPNRWQYLNKLAASSALRPTREKAYQAMDALLDLAWP